MIYSVVPPELGEDVYRHLVEHYKDNPNVTVILDRRRGERRGKRGAEGEHGEKREVRDRRRRRLPGGVEP